MENQHQLEASQLQDFAGVLIPTTMIHNNNMSTQSGTVFPDDQNSLFPNPDNIQ
jgi:hypothetical protein